MLVCEALDITKARKLGKGVMASAPSAPFSSIQRDYPANGGANGTPPGLCVKIAQYLRCRLTRIAPSRSDHTLPVVIVIRLLHSKCPHNPRLPPTWRAYEFVWTDSEATVDGVSVFERLSVKSGLVHVGNKQCPSYCLVRAPLVTSGVDGVGNAVDQQRGCSDARFLVAAARVSVQVDTIEPGELPAQMVRVVHRNLAARPPVIPMAADVVSVTLHGHQGVQHVCIITASAAFRLVRKQKRTSWRSRISLV